SRFARAAAVLVLPVGGDRDEARRAGRGIFAQRARDYEAVAVGQADVAQHYVGPHALRGAQALLAGERDRDLVARVIEELAQAFGRVAVVLHHQHANTALPRAGVIGFAGERGRLHLAAPA